MSKSNSDGGISVIGLLGVAFVILKLTNVIDWSWWYVTLPFWGGIALVILGFGFYILYQLLTAKKGRVPKMNNPPKPPVRENKFQKKMNEMMKQAEEQNSYKQRR